MAVKEEVKHTPGPWREIYDPEDGRLLQIAGPCREHKHCHKTVLFHSAHTPSWDGAIHDPENCHCLANARLIAAAPELLQAAKYFVEWVEDVWGSAALGENTKREYELAKTAIAKAEGRKRP